MARAPPVADSEMGALLERAALRCALAAPSAGEIENLGGAGRERQHHAQGGHVDGLGALGAVGQRGADAEHAVVIEGKDLLQFEPQRRVRGPDRGHAPVSDRLGDLPPGSGVAARAVERQARRTEPAVGG